MREKKLHSHPRVLHTNGAQCVVESGQYAPVRELPTGIRNCAGAIGNPDQRSGIAPFVHSCTANSKTLRYLFYPYWAALCCQQGQQMLGCPSLGAAQRILDLGCNGRHRLPGARDMNERVEGSLRSERLDQSLLGGSVDDTSQCSIRFFQHYRAQIAFGRRVVRPRCVVQRGGDARRSPAGVRGRSRRFSPGALSGLDPSGLLTHQSPVGLTK